MQTAKLLSARNYGYANAAYEEAHTAVVDLCAEQHTATLPSLHMRLLFCPLLTHGLRVYKVGATVLT
jgi:hypothetical protein